MIRGRVDSIIKFALAAAGQEDSGDKELGPIHLVKYVYLADLAYAKTHAGSTYTEAPWRFYHFGPWAEEVFQRIKPVMEEISSTERIISSPKYGDDFCRWSIEDDDLYEKLYDQLPFEITGAIKRALHTFGSDTAELLHYVYRTRPMLQAAPEESLNFSVADTKEEYLAAKVPEQHVPPKPSLSVSQKRAQKASVESLKKNMAVRLKNKISLKKMKNEIYTIPRYDEVYFEGVRWLDSLAGEPIEEGEGVLEITEETWKSPFRTDDELL